VQCLLDQGAHMHLKTVRGDQALHLAMRHRQREAVPVVQFLLTQGADQTARDGNGKCLKDGVRDNILLKHVIADAKKHIQKHGTFDKMDSFTVLDLRGERLYSSTGFEIKKGKGKDKKTEGQMTVYAHGLLFAYKKGFLSKSTVEQFMAWTTNTQISADAANSKLLWIAMNTENAENEEKKDSENENDKFGICPCRPSEISELIENAIAAMFPTYALQRRIEQLVSGFGDAQGLALRCEEFETVRRNCAQSEREAAAMSQSEKESDSFHRLQSEVKTMRARLSALTGEAQRAWTECESVEQKEVEPLIQKLCGDIDAMIANNEHWKMISNVRESLQMAKGYRKRLIELRTILRPMIVQTNEMRKEEIEQRQNEPQYSTV